MTRAFGLLLWILTAAPVAAADCRLALTLAIDVSSSVDTGEDQLQRKGLAAALLAPEVQAALFASPAAVALSAFEWSGRTNQAVLLDWTLIRTPADLLSVAEVLASSPRSTDEFPTALGHAVSYGWRMLDRAPQCDFATIDVSGDGINNEGYRPTHAYRAFGFDAITVNGLAILTHGDHEDDDLLIHYQTELRHGPGSFVEVAQGYADFERAMRRKLERELRPFMMGGLTDR